MTVPAYLAAREALEKAGGGFTSWCLTLLEISTPINCASFPLRGSMAPTSNASLAFQAQCLSVGTTTPAGSQPLAHLILGMYTLAGVDGPLPLFLSERMVTEKSTGGSVLHAFLDLLNLRFWELVLLRDTYGHDPRYIGFAPAHARRLDQLTHAVARTRVPDHFDDRAHLHRLILQHGFTAGNLGGNATNLGQVLSALLACKVNVIRNTAVRIEIAQRFAIGHMATRGLSRGAILGARAWVASGTTIVIHCDSAPTSARACEHLLDRANWCVALLFGPMASLVSFQISIPPSSCAAELGTNAHRLGRMAVLGRGAGAIRSFSTSRSFRPKLFQEFTNNIKEIS